MDFVGIKEELIVAPVLLSTNFDKIVKWSVTQVELELEQCYIRRLGIPISTMRAQ